MEKDTTINVVLNDINYIPGYAIAEADRRAYYEDFKQHVENGDFVNKIIEDSATELNEIANSKLEEFNNNASAKTTGYNSNADTKLQAYDDNASTKLEAYNTNATATLEKYNTNASEKRTEYNANAETKLKAYNDNATEKLNSYDTNASNALSAYNANVSNTTSAYNTNANNKLQSYNSNAASAFTAYNNNASAKLEEYNTNATEKLNVYNTNVDTKLQEYNTNATETKTEFDNNASSKLEEYNSNATAKKDEFNQNASSYNERITGNENNIVDLSNYLYNLIPKKTVKGQSVHITDSLHLPVLKLGVDGPHKQITTKGQQLFDVSDVKDFSSGVAVDEDGWITVTCDNANGTNPVYSRYWTNNLNLKPDTEYALLVEISNINGNFGTEFATIHSESQISNSIYKVSNALTLGVNKFIIKTKNSFNNTINGLRSVFTFNAGNSGSIKFRLSVLEDTSVTADNFVYEPYSGGQESPSPNWEQPIEVIEEDFDVTSCSKNFLPIFEGIKTYNGRTYDFKNGGVTISGVSTDENTICMLNGERLGRYASQIKLSKENSKLFKAGTYYFNRKKVLNDLPIIMRHGQLDTVGTDLSLSADYQRLTLKLEQDEYVTLLFYDYRTTDIKTIMQDFIISTEYDTEYEPYQGSQVTFEIPEGEFFGSVSDTIKDEAKIVFNEDDGQYHKIIEKNVGKVVLDGSIGGYNADDNWFYISFASLGITPKLLSYGKTFISDYFIDRDLIIDKTVNGISFTAGTHLIIRNTNLTNANEYKAWLSENKPEVYYQLAEPYTIDLGVVDPIETFEGTTNINVNTNLEPEIEVTYGQDFMKLIAAVSNQLL